MRRAAQLLQLLLACWLLSSSPHRGSSLVLPVAASRVVEKEHARPTVEHAVLDLAPVQVARAPLLFRAPAAPWVLTSGSVQPLPSPVSDLREALRRVQTRRRLPRLSPQEPPWC